MFKQSNTKIWNMVSLRYLAKTGEWRARHDCEVLGGLLPFFFSFCKSFKKLDLRYKEGNSGEIFNVQEGG